MDILYYILYVENDEKLPIILSLAQSFDLCKMTYYGTM